ncbi:MAG TPA: hypothetical protein PKO07_24965 [Pseudomonadota bacterium]|nr:hypothetical protein [Pseudomonadota bacterium]
MRSSARAEPEDLYLHSSPITSLETEKRASRIAVLSVGSVGLLFALIVLVFGGKGEHVNPAAAPAPAAEKK